ncbi:uncharacterized protein TNCV_1458001 [Trichonephila clavipes]|nr:uncharacterized protein TNCV_1458001 [Trichonephila clavipes]
MCTKNGSEAVVKIYRFWNSGAGGARRLRRMQTKEGGSPPDLNREDAVEKKQFNSPPQLENQSQCRIKTTQLVSRNETTQLNKKTTQLSSRNEQLNSSVGTKQLNSSVGTKQLNSALTSTAYNAYNRLQRLQPPATAYNRLQPPATAYNHLQPPTTACTAYNRLQPPLQQNRLFLPKERTTQLGNRNSTTNSTQQEKTTQLVSRNETNSALPSTAYNRLQPPATAYDRLRPPTTACNRLRPPATAYDRLQPPATACNRLQPPAPPAPPLQQNRLAWLVTLTAVPLDLGSNPGEDMDVCKCIVLSQHGGTLNSRRATSPLVRLVEVEERREALPLPGYSPSQLG